MLTIVAEGERLYGRTEPYRSAAANQCGTILNSQIMRTVGLVDLGENLLIKLPRLAKRLNKVQRTFQFCVLEARPNIGPADVADQWNEVNKLFQELSAVHGAQPINFVVGVTHVRFTDPQETEGRVEKDYFSKSDCQKFTVITEAMARHNSPRKSIYQYCAYLMIEGLLINMCQISLNHLEVRYCLFDECEDRVQFRLCIDRGQICKWCEAKLKECGMDEQTLKDVNRVLRWYKRDTFTSSIIGTFQTPWVTLALGVSFGWLLRNFVQISHWPSVVAVTAVVVLLGIAYNRWIGR